MRAPIIQVMGVGIGVLVPALPEASDYLGLAEQFEREAKQYEEAAKSFRGIANHFRREAEKVGVADDGR